MNQQRDIIDGLREQEQAAIRLLDFQEEVTDRLWAYRTKYAYRQPADVTQCYIFQQFIDKRDLGEL